MVTYSQWQRTNKQSKHPPSLLVPSLRNEQPVSTIIDVYIIIVLKHQRWHIIGKFIVIASDNKYGKTHINNYHIIFSS